MKAFTLFNIKSHISAEEYRKWSLEQVHPRMLKMPSVLGFRDYEIGGIMGGGQTPYQFVEEIEITNPEDFERDNAQGDGAALAEEWQSRVSDFTVIYCHEIKDS
jgi:hypothetical protein